MLLTLALHLSACGFDAVEHKTNNPGLQRHLIVIVYDISASVDMVAVLRPAHFEMLYDSLGGNGGGKVYGLHIKSNSRKQDPVSATVPALEQLAMKGNAFQRANRRKINSKTLGAFDRGRPQFVEALASIIQPKTERFSDVENALVLAKQLTEMPTFEGWIKHVIIISDMEHDLPPVDGLDKMQLVQFEDDVILHVVRPSRRVTLEQLLSGTSLSVYSTIDDAIESMFTPRRGLGHGK
jgi:hypothetical protein